jgi:hypothetical protein
MSKIFRKLTNGFRSNWGRDLFAAVRSVVNTGKRHGFNAFEAIIKALSFALPDFLFKPGGAITSHLCKVYRSFCTLYRSVFSKYFKNSGEIVHIIEYTAYCGEGIWYRHC